MKLGVQRVAFYVVMILSLTTPPPLLLLLLLPLLLLLLPLLLLLLPLLLLLQDLEQKEAIVKEVAGRQSSLMAGCHWGPLLARKLALDSYTRR
jgi:hypothetical protein